MTRNNLINKKLKKYYKEIKNNIPYPSKQSSRLINDLYCSIDEYINEHPTFQMQDVITEFGSPEEIASYYISELKPISLRKKLSLKRYVFISSILIFITCILACISIYLLTTKVATYKSYNILEIETSY